MRTTFSRKEHTDSGLALLLLLLVFFLIYDYKGFLYAAVGICLIVMILPLIIYPFTWLWLNLSHFLGSVMSRIILSLIFIVFVIPVGTLRRLLGKDALKLKQFKQTQQSVFETRNHSYTKEDIENPY